MTDGATSDLPPRYQPQEVEEKLYAWWESQGYFAPREDASEAYTIMMPPPNVTGSLHMGHACRVAFEDVLTRYARMLGKAALWLPGTDHAGIATQLVVSRQLEAQGSSRDAIGREAFVSKVWDWKASSGGRIMRQLRELGASCDWSRECFTLNEDYSQAVKEAFVRLHEEGLIYRGERLVNWSIVTQTAVSDLEVEFSDEAGQLYDFAYPLAEGEGEIVVSTTRPETLFGDTAVAVHPDDPRYANWIGRELRHPFVDRRVPVIADAELVDPKFGTGAVKVTPAHDPNDFETGKRHGLAMITVIDPHGRLNENAGNFAGIERFEARKRVVQALDEAGLLRGQKDHAMRVPRSQRGGEVIEPRLSTQWFVRMASLAAPALKAVADGELRFFPEDWSKTYNHWLEHIQDWCISRQLWWGHPIPAVHCSACGHISVSREPLSRCSACGSEEVSPDPDVLDTWFSSALWPFATLGWPDETPDLKKFYPGDDLETGYDILFFWVARMIMMGLHFTGELPFRRVLLSGLVTDERGDKMSKVKGNVIDPLDVIRGASLEALQDKARGVGAKPKGIKYLADTYPEGFTAYGADALRLTLLSYSPQQRRIALSLKRIEGYRNFTNKLWNAARLVLSSLPEGTRLDAPSPEDLPAVCRWIKGEAMRCVAEMRAATEAYRLDDAVQAAYHFLWDTYCDWYLELMKAPLKAGGAAAQAYAYTALEVLECMCRALHPLMPFVTETLWQKLPGAKSRAGTDSIMLAAYPEVGPLSTEDDRALMQLVQAVTGALRALRTQHAIPRQTQLRVEVESLATGLDEARLREPMTQLVAQLTGSSLSWTIAGDAGARDALLSLPGAGRFWVRDVVDIEAEKARLNKEVARTEKDLALATRKLSNASFVERAPEAVVTQERERETQLTEALAALKTQLERLA